MTTVAPVNKLASVDAIYDETTFDRTEVPAGHFHYFVKSKGGDISGMLFGCPCGCGELKSVSFRPHAVKRPSWEWNGDRNKPTLSPSINILQFNEQGQQIGEHWHGWLRDGRFVSC